MLQHSLKFILQKILFFTCRSGNFFAFFFFVNSTVKIKYHFINSKRLLMWILRYIFHEILGFIIYNSHKNCFHFHCFSKNNKGGHAYFNKRMPFSESMTQSMSIFNKKSPPTQTFARLVFQEIIVENRHRCHHDIKNGNLFLRYIYS